MCVLQVPMSVSKMCVDTLTSICAFPVVLCSTFKVKGLGANIGSCLMEASGLTKYVVLLWNMAQCPSRCSLSIFFPGADQSGSYGIIRICQFPWIYMSAARKHSSTTFKLPVERDIRAVWTRSIASDGNDYHGGNFLNEFNCAHYSFSRIYLTFIARERVLKAMNNLVFFCKPGSLVLKSVGFHLKAWNKVLGYHKLRKVFDVLIHKLPSVNTCEF